MRVLWLILSFVAGEATAQTYPTHPIRLIIPAGPGGGVDTISRALGTPLGGVLGQPIVMDNRPGAGTMFASELTAKAPADGYTLLMITNSHAIDAGIRNNLPFDPFNDFDYVSLVASLPYWIVVHPSVLATNVRELIALARKRPGELYFASAGYRQRNASRVRVIRGDGRHRGHARAL